MDSPNRDTARALIESRAVEAGIDAANDAVSALPAGQKAWSDKEYMIAETAARYAVKALTPRGDADPTLGPSSAVTEQTEGEKWEARMALVHGSKHMGFFDTKDATVAFAEAEIRKKGDVGMIEVFVGNVVYYTDCEEES